MFAYALILAVIPTLTCVATGTFYIDPRNAIVKKRKKSGKQPVLPHASFRSRAGAIQLALGTAGIATENPSASVQVASGTGNIDINLVCDPFRDVRHGQMANLVHSYRFLPWNQGSLWMYRLVKVCNMQLALFVTDSHTIASFQATSVSTSPRHSPE